jgi:hypothetical protein
VARRKYPKERVEPSAVPPVAPPFCAYCFGGLDLLRPIATVGGRSYHPGCDEHDKPLARMGDGSGGGMARIGGRGGSIAIALTRQQPRIRQQDAT